MQKNMFLRITSEGFLVYEAIHNMIGFRLKTKDSPDDGRSEKQTQRDIRTGLEDRLLIYEK